MKILFFLITLLLIGCSPKKEKKNAEPTAVEKTVQDMTGISTIKEGEAMKKKILEADSLNKKKLEEAMEGIE